MKRRDFIKAGLAAMPLFNVGCAGFGQGRRRQVARGAKIRVALIGCGHRMREMIEVIICEKVVALVDPDPKCRERLKKMVANIPGGPQSFAGAREFFDYRAMFDEMGDEIDAVIIATPNHHHALPAVLAMRRGIHVYVEKPMALTVEEAQYMGRVARETGVTTQVGNFGHSTGAMKACVEALRTNVIGDVTDVWCYDDRCNALSYRPPASKPPAGMDWDAWIGPAPYCDYYGPHGKRKVGLHPHDFHCWIGYGNGSIGNMGTHIIDAPFFGLDLGARPASSVVANVADTACDGSWTYRTQIDWTYPENGRRGPITLHWHDGLRPGLTLDSVDMNDWGYTPAGRKDQFMPEAVLKCERDYHLEKAPFLSNGSLFVGTKGCLWFGHHSMCRFLPKSLGRDMLKRIKWAEQARGHMAEFYSAIREGREANAGFTFSVPLAETVLLGNVAGRAGAGKRLLWNGRKVTNDDAANKFLSTTYRDGWNVFV